MPTRTRFCTRPNCLLLRSPRSLSPTSGSGCSKPRSRFSGLGPAAWERKQKPPSRKRLPPFARAWRFMGATESHAQDVAQRFTAFATPIMKPTIVPAARPGARFSPTAVCRGCWEQTGLAPWMSWKRSSGGNRTACTNAAAAGPTMKRHRAKSGGRAGKHEKQVRLPREVAVLYEDDAVVALDKPPGLAAVPPKGSDAPSAWSLLAAELRQSKQRVFVVHRI